MEFENQALEIILLLLLLATLVGMASRRLRLPYTVGLVLAGLLLSLINQPGLVIFPPFISNLLNQAEAQITPRVILGLLVTPLVFEAAFNLHWRNLQRDLPLILLLAVPGVILTTLLVGWILSLDRHFTLPAALVFGAAMSATDPVSVITLFRSLGVPKRLEVIVEAESLLNDGTAIVIFTLMLNLATHPVTSNLVDGIQYLADFFRTTGGGLIVGFGLGWGVAAMIQRIDDYLIETTLTTVLAFGAFVAGESLQVSGVLAVVAAGLMCGNISPRGMSPTTRIIVSNFWEYAAFIANSFIFLLIGLETKFRDLAQVWQPILLAILAVLIARAATIYGLARFGKKIPFRWEHVMLWGGLRGAISLTLAAGLPQLLGEPAGGQLKTMAVGVVLFTILVQGFSMEPLVRRLGLAERSEMRSEYERRHARAVAARAAYDHLSQLYREGVFSYHTWQSLAPVMDQRFQALANAVKDVVQTDPEVAAEELDSARRESLRAQRSTLLDLLTGGVISDEVYSQLIKEVDMALEQNNSWSSYLNRSGQPIQRLMTAVIQIQDFENTVNALNKVGLPVTQLASSGGFLGRRNVTLLIGLGQAQEELAVKTLSQTCRRRVEYVATPLEGAPYHMPISTPITVGGATIFTLEVERYEEIP